MTDLDPQLSAYLDGELSAAEANEVERRLAVDAGARERLRAFRESDDLLRRAFGPGFTIEAGAVPSVLRSPAVAPLRRRPLLRRAAALAAMLLIGVIAFGAGYKAAGHPDADEFLDDVMGYHAVYARETEHLVELPASRVDELTAWLGERLGRKVAIPDLSPFGLTFAGGRMLVADGRPVAQLIYTRAGSMPLGVCVTKAEKQAAGVAIEHKNGVDAASWVRGDYAYVVVGQAPDTELRKVAEVVAAAYGS
jgi:anti-sigma factor RsiW